MPSLFGHAIASAAITRTGGGGARVPARLWWLAGLCAVLPDVDVVAFRLGIPYGHPFGHRGFSHSLTAAALVAFLVAALAFRDGTFGFRRAWAVLFLAMASHGVLDAMTTGGRGVAFFAPFHNQRYFLPWRPIVVSPISVRRFFTARGLAVMRSELLWVWTPALAVILLAGWRRRRR